MLSFEVLIATINQMDDSLLDRMNIQSDVIVCNQNEIETSYKQYVRNGFNVRWYDFQEKGVGLNRNNALLRASADICLLADDDIIFCDGYMDIIIKAFNKIPKADLLLFNVDSNGGEERYSAKKVERIGRRKCGRFGAVRMAFRRMAVVKNTISFNLLFGGGAMFTAGEDTMFLEDCIRKHMVVYAVPYYILTLKNDRASTWFEGYNEKFFEDMGSSYYVHYKLFASLLASVQLFRHRRYFLQHMTYFEAKTVIKRGIKKYRLMR